MYGKAKIEETEVKERENKETGEKFKTKSLIFRENGKYRFKIDLARDKQRKNLILGRYLFLCCFWTFRKE